MLKRIAEFMFEVGMLKRTHRTGYPFLGSGGESVADHSFRTAVIGYVLATMEPDVNRDKVIRMCLFHDFPEARTGDHNYVNKKYVLVDEEKALEDQLEGLPFGTEVSQTIREFNGQESLEARLARDADQLDLILELKEQLDLGNSQAAEWIVYARQRLLTDAGKRLAETIIKTPRDAWWFDRKTDWWVNGPRNNGRRGNGA